MRFAGFRALPIPKPASCCPRTKFSARCACAWFNVQWGCSAASPLRASVRREQLGIPGHLPQVLVRVLEVALITAPERILRRLGEGGASRFGAGHDRVDFRF